MKPKRKIPKKSVKTKVNTQKCGKKKSNPRDETKKLEATKYSADDLKAAVSAVKNGMSLREAAKNFNVPKSTVSDYVKKGLLDKQIGQPTILTIDEEEKIASWIIYRAEHGTPVTKEDLFDAVQHYVLAIGRDNVFTDGRPGRHWYEGFKRRHPQISLRKPQNLTSQRASVCEEELREWFKSVGNYLKSKGLHNLSPSRVFNCDETNMSLCPKEPKVLAQTGAKAVYTVTEEDEKEGLTTLFTYDAMGRRAPPMTLYWYQEGLPESLIKSCPKNYGLGNSETGWMTTETFYEYIANIFYPWLVKEKTEFPVILYLDGHKSHVTIPLVEFCREKQIEIISLFPNSTHILQPLDVSFFHPLKVMWRKTVRKWKADNEIRRFTKDKFPTVCAQTLDALDDSVENIIINGFKRCGLVPFDPDAIEYDILRKKRKLKIQKDGEISTPQSTAIFPEPMTHSFLLELEKHIPPNLLQEFKAADELNRWDGNIQNEGFYNFWRNMKQKYDGINDENTTVDTESARVEELMELQDTLMNPIDIQDLLLRIDKSSSFADNDNAEALTESNPDESLQSVEIDCTQQIEHSEYTDSSSPKIPESNYSCFKIPGEDAKAEDDAMILIIEDNLLQDFNGGDYEHKILKDKEFLNVAPAAGSSAVSVKPNNLDAIKVLNGSKLRIKENKLLINHVVRKVTMIEEPITSCTEAQNEDRVFEKTRNPETSEEPSCSENTSPNINRAFKDAFLCPTEYLPKKKQERIQKGKPKFVAAALSDDWQKMVDEKEAKKREEEEKRERKKDLQQQKKDLMKRQKEELQRLQEEIKDCAKKRIKKEKKN